MYFIHPPSESAARRARRRLPALALAAALLFAGGLSRALPASLTVTVRPMFAGQPLQLGVPGRISPSGESLSVTRLSYLVSSFALEREDGTWLELTNTVAWMDAERDRGSIRLPDLPRGAYRRIRFHIGLEPALNHGDPAALPSDHPLNPNLDRLHWSWQGGYVFLALEGGWLKPGGVRGGYSYHLANDPMLMTVQLPVALNLASDHELQLALEIGRIFSGQNQVRLSAETASTHSREGDALAAALRENFEQAFRVEKVAAAPARLAETPSPSKVELAAGATPYRLKVAATFPRPALPRDNPLTEEGVELGRRLFEDERLSIHNSQSCASCHRAEAAFSDAGRRFSSGAEGRAGSRNAMALLNLAWKQSYFWDGRAASLREQVLQPIQNPIEMHETLDRIVAKLAEPRDAALFNRAFGTPEVTPDRIARALEQFLLVQVSFDSKFDRALRGAAELTEEEKRGLDLFHTEYDPRRGQFGADCFHCHGGPLFQSQDFANNGLDNAAADPGRSRVTGKDTDLGKFAVPSLRNVALTGPYMHDGRFETLEEVVEHYCTGVRRSLTLDPNLAKHPDGGVPLNDADKKALVAFLKTLTDERFTQNPSAAPGS